MKSVPFFELNNGMFRRRKKRENFSEKGEIWCVHKTGNNTIRVSSRFTENLLFSPNIQMWFNGQLSEKNLGWFLTARFYLVNYGSLKPAWETILSFMTITYTLYYISFLSDGCVKVIYTKYSKHWPYTVAHTIDYVCNEMNNPWFNPWFNILLFKPIPCPIHWIVCVLAYLCFILNFWSSFSAAQNGPLCPDTQKYEFHLNCLEHSICISLFESWIFFVCVWSWQN